MMLMVGVVVIVVWCVVGVVLGLVQHALSINKQCRQKGGWYGKHREAGDDDGSRYRRATDGPYWMGS